MTDESDIDTMEQTALANDDEGGEGYVSTHEEPLAKMREASALIREALELMDETWETDEVETVRNCADRIDSIATWTES